MNEVHLGNLVFQAGRVPKGAAMVCTGLPGWRSGPPMRADVEDRPNNDGAFGSVRNFRSARALRFEGWVRAGGPGDSREELFDQFAAIQADGEPIQITVITDTSTRSVTATLVGEPEVEEIRGERPRADVVARFVCYDPLKYGEQLSSSVGLPSAGGGLEYPLESPAGALYYGTLGDLGRVDLTNDGTADSSPVFQVTGALTSGFYIQNITTGEVLRYDRIVPAGSFVSIDSRTGEVLIDGVSDASTYLTRDEYFAVPAGGTITVQFNAIGGSSGGPTMTAQHRSAWW